MAFLPEKKMIKDKIKTGKKKNKLILKQAKKRK